MVNTTLKSTADVRRAITSFNSRLEDMLVEIMRRFYLSSRQSNRAAWDAAERSASDVKSKTDNLYYVDFRLNTLNGTRRRAVAVKKIGHAVTTAWADAVLGLIDGVTAEAQALINDKAAAIPATELRKIAKETAVAKHNADPSYQTLRAAIEPQRAGYTHNIFGYLRREVDSVLALLAKHNGDAHLAAPYPYKLDRFQFRSAERLYREVRKWTTSDVTRSTSRGPNDPEYRVPMQVTEINEKLMAEANRITEADFNSYATKLAVKIANGRDGVVITEARVDGTLWTHSVLKAKANVIDEDSSACEGFSVEDHAWSTQMILNRSSLGTIFNQWPTRRVS